MLPPEGWQRGRGPEGPEDKGHSHSRAQRAREWQKHASPRARRARGRAKLSARLGACQCYYMFFTTQLKIAKFKGRSRSYIRIPLALSWHCGGTLVALWRHSRGTVAALSWHCGGTLVALWRHSHGTVAALSWHSGGTLMWHSRGTLVALSWHSRGTVMALSCLPPTLIAISRLSSGGFLSTSSSKMKTFRVYLQM